MKVLVINAGSSSLKYQLIDMTDESVLAKGNCERIGTDGAFIGFKTSDGQKIERETEMKNHTQAFEAVKNAILDPEYGAIKDLSEVTAIGHRVVQGGAYFDHSVLIDADVLDKIKELSPLACAYAKARGADRMSSYGDFIALSDVCDVPTAKMIQREVSDGVIAPGYEPEALEILKSKRKGTYCIIKMDENYVPNPIERKQVYGVTFEQGRNELVIDDEMMSNIVTENKELPETAKHDLIISLITLKYTQSNSVCYVKDGQAIGVGAGQQSRVHCTRLAGNKADNWYLRQNEKVLNLPFKPDIRRPDRDNTIDVYISDDYDDVLRDGTWELFFTEKPEPFTKEEKKAWLATMSGVSLGSDAFFPFGDNIERAKRSGVQYIAEPGGSIRDDNVIETCNKYGMTMVFTGIRLFHH